MIDRDMSGLPWLFQLRMRLIDARCWWSEVSTETRQWRNEMRWWWLGVTLYAKPLMAQLRTWPRFRSSEWNHAYENSLQLVQYDLNQWTNGKPPVRPEPYVPSWIEWRGAPGYLARPDA